MRRLSRSTRAASGFRADCMPEHTPFVKIANTERRPEVVLAGETLAEAREKALVLGAERGLTFVHPYDDPM